MQRIVKPIPGLRYALPFYALRYWVKIGHPIRLFEHLHKTYGNIAQYRFMGTSIIFINDPATSRTSSSTTLTATAKSAPSAA